MFWNALLSALPLLAKNLIIDIFLLSIDLEVRCFVYPAMPIYLGASCVHDLGFLITNTNSKSNTFLTLHLYARRCFAPTIQAMSMDQKTGDGEAVASSSQDSKMLSILQSKIRELDLTLSRARQSTLHSIPHVFLQTHPILQSVKLSSDSKIDLEELGLSSYLTNDTFLNEVQAKVNSWIQLIRKVTTLPSSHTFSQSDLEEVSYWANLHSVLQHIREELSKPYYY